MPSPASKLVFLQHLAKDTVRAADISLEPLVLPLVCEPRSLAHGSDLATTALAGTLGNDSHLLLQEGILGDLLSRSAPCDSGSSFPCSVGLICC